MLKKITYYGPDVLMVLGIILPIGGIASWPAGLTLLVIGFVLNLLVDEKG